MAKMAVRSGLLVALSMTAGAIQIPVKKADAAMVATKMSAPVAPPLDPESGAAPVPDERDWNEGQRTTRRAALLTAAGFGLAGLAAFAMVSSPFAVTLDNADRKSVV